MCLNVCQLVLRISSTAFKNCSQTISRCRVCIQDQFSFTISSFCHTGLQCFRFLIPQDIIVWTSNIATNEFSLFCKNTISQAINYCPSCGALGLGTFFYQSIKSSCLTDRHQLVSEADHFYTLEISRTQLDDGGLYTVTAQNCLGAVSCHCQLTVDKGIRAYVAPDFVSELSPAVTVKAGAELRLFAQVEAYPSVGIAW